MTAADLLAEELISLAAAARLFPGARGAVRVNPATVHRWCTKGTRTPDGNVVKLEFVRAGCRVLTSRQAVARYVAALSVAPESAEIPTRSPLARKRAADAAAAALKAMGA